MSVDNSNIKVYVGMSGGVDSSVTAALLNEQGYDVTGVYMKNWSQDLPGFQCPWQEDYQDAKRVAVQLDIPFKMYDFETQYRQKVVDYMLDGYRAGITPNPDIMCNQEIKFKLFLDTALADGADMIATGHYARVACLEDGRWKMEDGKSTKSTALLAGVDKNKDQSYFLYRVNPAALDKVLMPVGELTKPEVRKIAKRLGLSTADKKDSQGICFVGKVGIREFLEQFVETEPGDIVDQHGRTIGRHDGALFYTIGQRHGLNVGGGLPYYVTGKDMAKNEVYVTTDLNDDKLWRKELRLVQTHELVDGRWDMVDGKVPNGKLRARTRYRAPLVDVTKFEQTGKNEWKLTLAEAVRAVTPGQSTVIYRGYQVLGGGVVA